MALILFLALLVLIFIIKQYVNDTHTRGILYLFVGYWFTSLILSTFSPFGLYKVHGFTYVLLVLGVYAFVLGMILSPIQMYSDTTKFTGKQNVIYAKLMKMLNSNVLLILYVSASFFCLFFARKALAIAAFQNHAEMVEQYELIFDSNSLSLFVFSNIITPLFHIMLVLLSFWLINRKELKTNYIIRIIVFVFFFICYTIISGSRSVFLVALLYLASVYFFSTTRQKLFRFKFKSILIILSISLVVYMGVSIMNSYRLTGELTLNSDVRFDPGYDTPFQKSLKYSVIPIALFDRALQSDCIEKYGGLKYGKATFTGLDSWMGRLLKYVGITHKGTSFIVADVQENYYNVAPEVIANYAYTGVFYHYLDFGFLGAFLFPFLFGIIYRKLINLYYRSFKISVLLLLCLGFFMMMHSVFTCYFIKGWVFLYIIVLLIVSRIERSVTYL